MKLLSTALLVAAVAFAQPPAPKNLKLLTADENLIPTMRSFTVALNVKCDFCHVQGDFASDEKKEKGFARHMITMAKGINGEFKDGKVHVTCYTCHRGATEPAIAPPDAAKSGQ
jgi:hypothetical protein